MTFSYKKFIGLILILAFCNSANAQSDTAKIIGIWEFTNFEFKTPTDDSEMIASEAKGTVIKFLNGNKFRTTKITNNKEELVGTGTYKISEDNKFIYQDGEEAEIILLNEKNLSLKVSDGIIMHLRKKNDVH